MTHLLAHQGGWDEILLVAGPVLVILGALAIAKRRVDRQVAAEHDDDDVADPARSDHPDGGSGE